MKTSGAEKGAAQGEWTYSSESLVVHLQLGTSWGSAQDRAVSGEKENTMATWGQKDEPSYEKLQNTRFWKEGWC